MFCIHSDIPNKPGLIVNDLSASTSHAFDSELNFIIIKPVIVDTACLDNSCSNNCVIPKPKESGTRAKFVPTCHNCGKIGHIRPNCYLLKSHKPWIKQDAMRKSEVYDSSSAKYVPPHRRHMRHNFAMLFVFIKAMLFVRMLIIILQRIQRSIQTKEACLPVITAASPVTSDPNAHNSRS
jgi:hypothetical protein